MPLHVVHSTANAHLSLAESLSHCMAKSAYYAVTNTLRICRHAGAYMLPRWTRHDSRKPIDFFWCVGAWSSTVIVPSMTVSAQQVAVSPEYQLLQPIPICIMTESLVLILSRAKFPPAWSNISSHRQGNSDTTRSPKAVLCSSGVALGLRYALRYAV